MLEHYIRSLLYEKDCVVIPGFGAIVANYQSAEPKNAQQTIAPPTKQLAFNESLKTNDGLLANYVADQKGITFAEALQFVREKANQWKQTLGRGEALYLEGIGHFYANKEGNVIFKPEEQANYNPQAFGLGEASLVPVKRAPISRALKEKKNKANKQNVAPSRVLIGLSSIGIAAVLLFFLLNTDLFNTGPHSTSNASIEETIASVDSDTHSRENVKGSDDKPSSSKKGKNKSLRDTGNKKYRINEPDKAVVETQNEENDDFNADQKTKKHPSEKSIEKSVEKKKKVFHLIAGSFKFKENAQKLASRAQRRGFNTHILKADNGFYRVSIGQYKAVNTARKFLNRIRQKGTYKVWLLNQKTKRNS